MSLEELGMLYLVLAHGRNVQNEAGSSFEDLEALRQYGRGEGPSRIGQRMNDAFCSGFGIADALAGRDDDYGLQLQYIIEKVLAPNLKVAVPFFHEDITRRAGAIERERWITDPVAWQRELRSERVLPDRES